jgi:hypothetical protein
VTRLLLIGVHDLLQWNTEFLAERLELLEVFCVLTLVLDLELDAWDGLALIFPVLIFCGCK